MQQIMQQITIPTKQLAAVAKSISDIAQGRSAQTFLTHAHVRFTESSMSLSASNGNGIDLQLNIGVEASGSGKFAVNAAQFAQITRVLASELTTIAVEPSQLRITCGSADFNLALSNEDDYPELVESLSAMTSQQGIVVNRDELVKSLSAVRYAAAIEEYRAVFRGVQLELLQERSRVVATDGFRLAYRDFAAVEGLDVARRVVIRNTDVAEILRLLHKRDEVSINFGHGRISLVASDMVLTVGLMDGELPDYERVVPKGFSVRLKLEVTRLRESISRVAVVADKLANNRVDFIAAGGRLQLVAESDSGRAQDVLETTAEGDPGTTIGFRAKQLLEALGPMEGEVTIDLGVRGAPAVFRASGDPNYLAIVVSLRE